jgi:hypothetical protein
MKTIRIGKFDVSKDAVWLYIYHFGRDKSDIFAWDRARIVFHDNIFESIGISRSSDEGCEFSVELDKFCEPHILKYDPMVATAKKLMRADTEQDRARANMDMMLIAQREKFMLMNGFRNYNANDKNDCRVCGKEKTGGVAFINDHLASLSGFDEINNPICSDCANNNPDAYSIAFKKLHHRRK